MGGYEHYRFTEASLAEGKLMSNSKYCELYEAAMKTLADYQSEGLAMEKPPKGKHGEAQKDSASGVSLDKLKAYRGDWCVQLHKIYKKTICNYTKYPLSLENVWFHTKCVLEDCINKNVNQASKPADCIGMDGVIRYTTLQESYDKVRSIIHDKFMPLLEGKDMEKGRKLPDKCPLGGSSQPETNDEQHKITPWQAASRWVGAAVKGVKKAVSETAAATTATAETTPTSETEPATKSAATTA